MTDHNSPSPQPRPTTAAAVHRRGRSLYRTVLSLAVAAVVAAWLPFSVLYVTALHHRPAAVSAISLPHPTSRTTRVITTSSGATRVVAANGPAATPAITAAPVTTRES